MLRLILVTHRAPHLRLLRTIGFEVVGVQLVENRAASSSYHGWDIIHGFHDTKCVDDTREDRFWTLDSSQLLNCSLGHRLEIVSQVHQAFISNLLLMIFDLLGQICKDLR